jgi:hypothetical protein
MFRVQKQLRGNNPVTAQAAVRETVLPLKTEQVLRTVQASIAVIKIPLPEIVQPTGARPETPLMLKTEVPTVQQTEAIILETLIEVIAVIIIGWVIAIVWVITTSISIGVEMSLLTTETPM